MKITESSGSCGARCGQHRGCHSDSVNDDLHGRWLVELTFLKCSVCSYLLVTARDVKALKSISHACLREATEAAGSAMSGLGCVMECHQVVSPTFAPTTSKDFGSCDAVPVGRRVAPPLLRAVVERLGQCHRDGEPLGFAQARSRRSLRCNAAPLPARPNSMGRPQESRQWVTVRVDPRDPSGALVVLVRCLSKGYCRSFRGSLFWRRPVARGRAPHHNQRRGRGRLTTCESRHSSVWYHSCDVCM